MQVSVSAKTIHFPQICACCLNTATTSKQFSFTRVKGKRVVHTDIKGWDFPYCDDCIEHVRLSSSNPVYSEAFWIGLWIYGVLFGCLLNGINLEIHELKFAFISGLFTIGIYPLYYLSAKLPVYEELIQSKCHPSCATRRWAVEYCGWHGSVHTFELHNATYASAFMKENQKKVVS